MCLVSIIIPIYNSSNTITTTVNSVLKQSFADFELILIDDGSTDDSLKKCEMYAKDKRVKIISKKNEGVSKTRNLGINLSKGKYIMFVDSDDELDLNMLYLLIDKAKSMDSDFVLGSMIKKIYKNNSIYDEIVYKTDVYINELEDFYYNIDKFLANCLIQGPCSKLFKSDILKSNNLQFPENLSYGEDTTFVYNYLDYVSSINYVPNSYYIYNVISNSNSLNTIFRKDKLKINLDLYSKLEELLFKFDPNFEKEIINEFVRTAYINYCMELSKSKEKLKFKINTIRMINSYPKIKDVFLNVKFKGKDLQRKILKILIKFNLTYFINMVFFFKKSILKLKKRK